jgi:hypothetical protein
LRKLTTSLVLEVFGDFACTVLKSLKFLDYSNLLRAEFQSSGRFKIT